ncbi:MAG: hypothetical protein J0H57_00610, partial [Rhodospirillales bacterium]|nr:hypothetical protein [Rhodospirillales bacterium]
EKVKKYLKYTQGAEDTKWLYFEMLQLHPVKVNLSFANVSAAERDSYEITNNHPSKFREN